VSKKKSENKTPEQKNQGPHYTVEGFFRVPPQFGGTAIQDNPDFRRAVESSQTARSLVDELCNSTEKIKLFFSCVAYSANIWPQSFDEKIKEIASEVRSKLTNIPSEFGVSIPVRIEIMRRAATCYCQKTVIPFFGQRGEATPPGFDEKAGKKARQVILKLLKQSDGLREAEVSIKTFNEIFKKHGEDGWLRLMIRDYVPHVAKVWREQISATAGELYEDNKIRFQPRGGFNFLQIREEKAEITKGQVGQAAASAKEPDTLSSRRATISRELIERQRAYRKEIDPKGSVVGSSPALLEIFEKIHHANKMKGGCPVLILGKIGVGKTHIAKLIHDSSGRSGGPFKAVNAGGGGGDLNIQRGEWIGYGKNHGISGIDPKGRAGHLMEVNGGTLFVDEFVAFSQDLQLIFLSVLEKRSVEKVGGESFEPDVRCIFATNADVDALADRRIVRPDLLARIPIRIHIPPLRDRRGDILLLAKHFAGEDDPLSERALFALIRDDWPANIRGLKQTVEKAIARKQMAHAASVEVTHLDLPTAIVTEAKKISNEDCRRKLWQIANEIARNEGFTHGTGLLRRAGEIMDVSESQASKMYKTFGLDGAGMA